MNYGVVSILRGRVLVRSREVAVAKMASNL